MAWTRDDLRGTAQALDHWWDLLTAGVPAELVGAASDGRPSVASLRQSSDQRLAASGWSAESVAARSTPAPQREAQEAAVEFALAALSQAGRTLAALGLGAPAASGTVVGVHVSDGGVPKRAVPAAYAGVRGLDGDRQAARKHHGRIWQALCLWSAEVIATLQAEGHPIAAGRAGENVTIAGLDWAALRPGTRVRIGDALAELSLPALPCRKNAQWFLDGRFSRMRHELHPGEARWYASVLVPGTIATGAPVSVEPEPAPALEPQPQPTPQRALAHG